MYITQSSFVGKTKPFNPSRTISTNPPLYEKTYPNKWSED